MHQAAAVVSQGLPTAESGERALSALYNLGVGRAFARRDVREATRARGYVWAQAIEMIYRGGVCVYVK